MIANYLAPMRTVPLLAFVLAFSGACSSPQPTASGAHTFGSEADPLFFSLERTPCFGKCPAYVITVDKDGKATYTGRTFADRPGTWKAQLDRPTLNTLLDRANAAGFFALEDRYDGPVTDLPSTIIRIQADGKDKKIVARYRTPEAFKAYAAFADSLLDKAGWEKQPAEE